MISIGEHSPFADVEPTEHRLKGGDGCRIEVFPAIDDYHTGVCITTVGATPPVYAEIIWLVWSQ